MIKKDSSNIAIKHFVMSYWETIDRLASRRFQGRDIAEEAVLYIFNELEKNDWRRIRSFKGDAQFSTYLSRVTRNLLEDYNRKHYGRTQPPAWIKRLGGVWFELYTFLCLKRFSLVDTVLKVQEIYRSISEEKIESFAEHLLGEIPDCGKSNLFIEYDDELAIDDTANKIEKTLEQQEVDLISKAIAREIYGEAESAEELRVVKKLIGQRLKIKPQEQLLIRLRFREGLAVTDICKILNLNRFQVYGRLRRVLNKIKEQFVQAGCEEELKILLG